MKKQIVWVLMAAWLGGAAAGAEQPVQSVVFVCEHGSVKSMIAAQWFNRLAAERGLRLVGLSRGVEPDAAIPAGVAANLRYDGFDVTGSIPTRLQMDDLAGARHVVVIGAESPLLAELVAASERWDDIPPASTSYQASRDALRERIEALLTRLAAAEPSEGRL